MATQKATRSWIKVLSALLGAGAAVFIAAQTISPRQPALTDVYAFSGTVVDENGGVRLAKVQIVGRDESDVTRSNGNFIIHVPLDKQTTNKSVRVKISCRGYEDWDESVTLPLEGKVCYITKSK